LTTCLRASVHGLYGALFPLGHIREKIVVIGRCETGYNEAFILGEIVPRSAVPGEMLMDEAPEDVAEEIWRWEKSLTFRHMET
jgi:hypothetical protein